MRITQSCFKEDKTINKFLDMVQEEDLSVTDAFVGGFDTIRKNIIVVSTLIAIALFLQVLSSSITMVLGDGKYNILIQILLSTATALLMNLLLVKCYFSLIAEESEIRDNTFYLIKQIKFTLFSILIWLPFFAITSVITFVLYTRVFTISTLSMIGMTLYLLFVLIAFDFLMIVMYVVQMEYVVTDKSIIETIRFMKAVLGGNKRQFFKKIFGVLGIQFTTSLSLCILLFFILTYVDSTMHLHINYIDFSLEGGSLLVYVAMSAIIIFFGYVILGIQYASTVSIFAIYFNYCNKAGVGLAGARNRKNLDKKQRQ